MKYKYVFIYLRNDLILLNFGFECYYIGCFGRLVIKIIVWMVVYWKINCFLNVNKEY